MTLLRGFTFAVSVFLCVSLARAQSNSLTQAQSDSVITDASLTFTTIDVPGAVFTGVSGINKAGDMVGDYGQNINAGAGGFLYSNGTFTYFDYPDDGGFTVPTGINDSNLIVGYAGNIRVVGFLYDGATFTTLRDGIESATFALGINNAADVVGGAGTAGATRGFELRAGVFHGISPPGGYVYVYDTGINNLGVIVGYTNNGGDQQGFTYHNGKFQSVVFPGASQTVALGINDNDVVVGWYFVSGSCMCAFASKNGKYISFSYPGAAFTEAAGINKSGQIVGSYTFDFQGYHGFITSPLTAATFR